MAFNPENRITWEELAPSLQELFKNLQSQITREVERARNEELRLDRKIDDEIARAKREERRIEDKLDDEIDRSTQEDQDIHDELDELKDKITEIEDDIDSNMSITITKDAGWRSTGGPIIKNPGEWEIFVMDMVTSDAKTQTQATTTQRFAAFVPAPAKTFTFEFDSGPVPYKYADAAQHAATGDEISISDWKYTGWGTVVSVTGKPGYGGNQWGTPEGHHIFVMTITGDWNPGDSVYIAATVTGYTWLNNFSKDNVPDYNIVTVLPKIAGFGASGVTYTNTSQWVSHYRQYA